ncbi:MAG: sigma-70 family RNA polymerase sigma factor, partial [Planctomycetota bacterium]
MPPLARDPASLLFARYREQGDPAALTELFESVAGELLALAGHLAPDLASAEDLLQDCFLAAIKKARRWNPQRPVLPWLAGILIREARSQRRRALRRLEVDRLFRPDTPEGQGTALRDELRQAVEAALAELPARYALVLREALLEGRDTREIASRHARAPGTVRVQLHRGLERLRRALPAGIGLGLFASLQPRGLSAVRRVIAIEARAAGPALAAGTTALTVSTLVGGIALSSKGLLTAASAVVLGMGWWNWQAEPLAVLPSALTVEQPDGLQATVGSSTGDSLGAVQGESTQRTEVSAPPVREATSERNPQPKAAFSASPILKGTLVVQRGIPEEGFLVEATLRAQSKGRLQETSVSTTLFAGGAFELDLEALGPGLLVEDAELKVVTHGVDYFICVEQAQRLSTEPDSEAVFEVLLEPDPVLCVIRGRLLGLAGKALRKGWIGLEQRLPANQPFPQYFHTTSPDADGRFELQLRKPQGGNLHFIAQGFAGGRVELDPPEARVVDVGELQLTRGASIEGQALDNGVPLPEGSEVHASLPPQTSSWALSLQDLQFRAGHVVHSSVTTEVDDAGNFLLRGLQAGVTYGLVAIRRERFSPWMRSTDRGTRVEAPAQNVVLQDVGIPVVLRVVASGQPVPRARIR